MLLLLSALIVAAAIVWSGLRVAAAVGQPRPTAGGAHHAELLALLAPAIAAVASDPRALLTWQPIAAAARALYPNEFAALDAAFNRPFPFGAAEIQAAHARWTTDWLAWERAHDAAFKLRAATAEEELGDRQASVFGRTRLEAIQQEKLDQYQRRYEEYTRVSKALRALVTSS